MNSLRRFVLSAAGLLALPLVACGGGGGGANGTGTTVVLPISPSFTGTMASFGPYSDALTDGLLIVGDEYYAGGDYEDRCFLSFDLGTLPTGAIITKAEVHLVGRIHTTGSPYLVMGSLLADHVDMGAAVSGNDFTDTIASSVAVLPTFTNDATYQAGVVPVTGSVQFDWENARPRASFRLRFLNAPYADALDERVAILVSGLDPSARPTLVVTYR